MTNRQKSWIKGLLQAGAVAGAVSAIILTWKLVDFPTPAWSSDIHRLDRTQTEIATELYNNKLRSLLAVAPPADPVARQNWDEEVRVTRQQRDNAEKRRLDLR